MQFEHLKLAKGFQNAGVFYSFEYEGECTHFHNREHWENNLKENLFILDSFHFKWYKI